MVRSPIQVEVNVQDCFFTEGALSLDSCLEQSSGQEDQIDRAPTSPSHPLISEETWTDWFRHWLEVLHPDLSPYAIYELSLRLTDDAEIQALNAQYRHKNHPTDVLAFAALEVDYPQLEEMQAHPLYLGDIVISVETAQRQADVQNHSLQQELAWLAAHALLHLLGWDHPDEASLTQMLQQQALLLQTIGLAIGYYQGENSIQQHDRTTDVSFGEVR